MDDAFCVWPRSFHDLLAVDSANFWLSWDVLGHFWAVWSSIEGVLLGSKEQSHILLLNTFESWGQQPLRYKCHIYIGKANYPEASPVQIYCPHSFRVHASMVQWPRIIFSVKDLMFGPRRKAFQELQNKKIKLHPTSKTPQSYLKTGFLHKSFKSDHLKWEPLKQVNTTYVKRAPKRFILEGTCKNLIKTL